MKLVVHTWKSHYHIKKVVHFHSVCSLFRSLLHVEHLALHDILKATFIARKLETKMWYIINKFKQKTFLNFL
jgi:hypothetical protein